MHLWLQAVVTEEEVPDYFDFVRRGQETALERISSKAKNNQFHSVAEVKEEVLRIKSNCEAYNTGGLMRNPGGASLLS